MVEQEKNQLYWIIDHEELYWAPGKIIKELEKEIYVQCIIDNEFYSIEKQEAVEVHPSCLEGVPDLLQLGDFNKGTLLHTIRVRYQKNQIYTSIGTPILISVNPYQKLKIFTTQVARKYRQYSTSIRSGNSNIQKPDPHLFMVAEESYQDMLIDNKNQSIIISGESGAGKTEATKIVLCYLAKANTNFVSNLDEDMLDQRRYLVGENNIEKQVLDSNPLLEAFGNAKTFKNNNSSRFGKFIQVNFEPSGKIHSASITNYLLEKSRIAFQQGVERNFHIFYQLMATPEIKQKYNLQSIEEYHYLNQSGIYQVKDLNDAEEFNITINCMKNIGFTQSEIDQILDIVIAILLLGNLEFENYNKQGVGDCGIISKASYKNLEQISKLLRVDQAQIITCLTSKKQTIGKEVIQTSLKLEEAYNSRDAMAKAIYGNLFNWLVKRINESISEKMKAKSGSNLKFIGLLDIFGFEIFKENSFEQLCINYANEKLQQQFNQHMFTLEQEEYKKEQVQWAQIQFIDNQDCIDLFEHVRNPSVFKLLDEECMIKGTDNGLLKKYNDMLSSNKKFKRPNKFGTSQFIICHYAGEVEYEINSFVDKNKDTVSDLIKSTLSNSQQDILSFLFKQEQSETDIKQQQQQQKQAFGQIKPIQGAGLKGNSLSNQFRTQLNELILTLKESQPRYIRCIKPNSKFSPTIFDSIDVGKQLSCAGMLEAIRIRKAGYAIRISQEDFAKRYRAILDRKKKLELPNKQVCELIVQEASKNNQFKKILDPSLKKIQIGQTKIFMKEEVRSVLEQAMSLAVLNQAKHIQRLWKGYKARQHFKKMSRSMNQIKHYIKKYMRRRKFRKIVFAFIKKMKNQIMKIQKIYRLRIRQKKIMKEIQIRIVKKKEQQEDIRKREEQQKRRLAEQELKKQQQEQKALNDQSHVLRKEQNDNQKLKEISSKPIDMSFSKTDTQKQNRFQHNMNRIEQYIIQDIDEKEKISELEQILDQYKQENQSLQSEILKLKQDAEDKDKKIRELTIRLQARKQNSVKRDLDSHFNDLSKIEMSFATTEDRMTIFPSFNKDQLNAQTFSQEFEKTLEQKDEEISNLQNQIEILELELQSKNNAIENFKEDNDQLQEKSKKWKLKLDQEIEKNSSNVETFTKKIKDLQEKNYKLECEYKKVLNEIEKKAIKDKSEELKRLEIQLMQKSNIIEDIELQKFNLEDRLIKEQSQLQSQFEKLKHSYMDLEGNYNQRKIDFEQLEEQLIQKDELVKQLEEENKDLLEQLESIQDAYGNNKSQYIDNLQNERIQASQATFKVKELQREVDKLKGVDKVKQIDLERFKEQIEKQKAKLKELENENEELVEQMYQLKREKSEAEKNELLFSDHKGQVQDINDFEKMQLQQRVEELKVKLDKKKEKGKQLDRENNFYHQSTTVFLTIKKIIDKEKKFCFMLAQETDVLQKKKLMDGITLCRQQSKQLDLKLKQILISARKNNDECQQ